METFRIRSQFLNNERRVSVYTPPGYDFEREPYHLLVIFDGFAYLRVIPTPNISTICSPPRSCLRSLPS